MKLQPVLSTSEISRRTAIIRLGAAASALSIAGRVDRASAQEATPESVDVSALKESVLQLLTRLQDAPEEQATPTSEPTATDQDYVMEPTEERGAGIEHLRAVDAATQEFTAEAAADLFYVQIYNFTGIVLPLVIVAGAHTTGGAVTDEVYYVEDGDGPWFEIGPCATLNRYVVGLYGDDGSVWFESDIIYPDAGDGAPCEDYHAISPA